MATTPTDPDPADTGAAGKGRPTPSRKEREAARKRPLVPTDRKAAAKQDRAAQRAVRDREYQALKTGDERHLPLRDKGPERRWVRDYVDARFNVGELFLPAALIGVIGMLASGASYLVSFIVVVVLYAYIAVVVVDAVLLGRRIRNGLTAKFGEDRYLAQRGIRLYGISRSLQLRRLRLPKPVVKRGEHPH